MKPYKFKNLYQIVFLVALTALAAHYIEKFIGSFNLQKSTTQDSENLIRLINKTVFISDSFTFNKHSDSCISYLHKCPNNEIDSLKASLFYYFKFLDDYTSDIINSIKDSGKFDTNNVFRSKTNTEIKEICIKFGENFSDFNKDICDAGVVLQEERDTMKIVENQKRTTELFRASCFAKLHYHDSISRVIYNRMFALKK